MVCNYACGDVEIQSQYKMQKNHFLPACALPPIVLIPKHQTRESHESRRSDVDMAHVDEEEEVLCAEVADDIADVLLEDGDKLERAEQPDDREDVPDDDDGDCSEGRRTGRK